MFSREIKQFANNLNALREFVEVVNPALESRLKDVVKEGGVNLTPLILALHAMDSDRFPVEEEVRNSIEADFGAEIVEAEDGTKSIEFGTNKRGQEFISAMDNFHRAAKHPQLLYQNSLVSLVSAAESFLSQLLHIQFTNCPGSAGVEDKSLKLKDLEGFASIDEARKYLIESRVDEILRGSFKDWVDFLKTHFQLKMGYLDDFYDHLIEICQRRNLIVHNGGYVNEIYLSKVHKELQTTTPHDVPVIISAAYLEESIACFEKAFVLIAAELWKRRSPTDEDRGNTLVSLIYDHLLASRWDIAQSFSHFLLRDKQISERCQLIGQVNYWQSLKWQGRFEEIQEQIEIADFSAKGEEFRFAQRALLDDETGFFEMLPGLLEGKVISESNLQEWPLFQKMRETESYKQTYAASSS